jgi:two-component system heavy metal sensor histidine kinase CusS
MQRLSLTARLTAYFSLSSAAVLLGLGILIALAMEEHFAVEDFTALGENVNVIRRVVESSSATEVSTRLNGPGCAGTGATGSGPVCYPQL